MKMVGNDETVSKLLSREVVSGVKAISRYADLPKIPERYPLSMTAEFVTGKAMVQTIRITPPVWVNIMHLVSNVHQSNLFILQKLMGGNQDLTLGEGLDLNSFPDREDPILGVPISFPWLSPANTITAEVEYTGLVPAEFRAAEKIRFCLTLICDSRTDG